MTNVLGAWTCLRYFSEGAKLHDSILDANLAFGLLMKG